MNWMLESVGPGQQNEAKKRKEEERILRKEKKADVEGRHAFPLGRGQAMKWKGWSLQVVD